MTDFVLGLVLHEERAGEHAGDGAADNRRARTPSTANLVVLGFLFAIGLITAVGAFAAFKGMSFAHFTRDPASVMGGPAYIGFISNVGIVLWISAAAAALTANLFLPLRTSCSRPACSPFFWGWMISSCSTKKSCRAWAFRKRASW